MKNNIKWMWKRTVAIFCLFAFTLASLNIGEISQTKVVHASSFAPSIPNSGVSGLGDVLSIVMLFVALASGESLTSCTVDFDSLGLTPKEYLQQLYPRDGYFCKYMTDSEYKIFLESFSLASRSDTFHTSDKVLVPGVPEEIWKSFEQYAGVESGYYTNGATQPGGISIDYGTIIGELSEFIKVVSQMQDPQQSPNPSGSPAPNVEEPQLPAVPETSAENAINSVSFSEAEFAKLIQTSFVMALLRAFMGSSAKKNQAELDFSSDVSADLPGTFSALNFSMKDGHFAVDGVFALFMSFNQLIYAVNIKASNVDTGVHSSNDELKWPDCQKGRFLYPIFYWKGDKLYFTIYTNMENCGFPNDETKSLFTVPSFLINTSNGVFPVFRLSKNTYFVSDEKFVEYFIRRFSLDFDSYENNGFLEFPDEESYEKFIVAVNSGTLTIPVLVDLLSHNWRYKTDSKYPELNVSSKILPISMQKSAESGELDKYKNPEGKIDFNSIIEGVSEKVSSKTSESSLEEIIGSPLSGTSTDKFPEPIKNPDTVTLPDTDTGKEPDTDPQPVPNPNPNPGTDPEPDPNPGTEQNPDTNPEENPDTKPEDIEPEQTKTPQLLKKFPFCVPWDLVDLVTNLSAEKKAPKWEIPFKMNNKWIDVNEKIVIDFSKYEQLAVICRWFLRIIFILSLVLLTRSIIKG